MKILQVITLYLPDFIGGASILCSNITDELKKEHTVKVFCGYMKDGGEPYSVKDYKYNGVPVRGVNGSPFYSFNLFENYYNPRVNSLFKEYVNEFSPDVIHFHSIQALGAQLIDAALDMGIPFVLTMHDWWWICNDMFLATRDGRSCPDIVDISKCGCMPKDFLRRRNEYLFRTANKVKFILATSNYLKESLIKNSFIAESIIVNENGLIKDIKPTGKRTKDKIVFSYLGGEWPHKGIKTIVDALMSLGADKRYEARLYGAGNYLRNNNIQKHASMTLLPRFKNEKLADVLSDTDVLIVPSVMKESFSLVTREAFLCDVPVICSDCGGAEEVVADGVNGFVFKTDDSDDLAGKMKTLIDAPEKIAEFKNNIDKNKIVSIESQVKELVGIYKKALDSTWEKYQSPYEMDCEVTEKKNLINDETHTYTVRNCDKMPFYLDPPFLYALENVGSSKLTEELAALFPVDDEEPEQIINTLYNLKLIKRL